MQIYETRNNFPFIILQSFKCIIQVQCQTVQYIFFFAVGCIVFTIFSTIFIWWCLTTYNSFINTKEINRLLNHNSRYISMEKLLPIKENNININVIASGSTSLGNLSPKKL